MPSDEAARNDVEAAGLVKVGLCWLKLVETCVAGT